jgi:adenylate kinase
MAKYIVLLGPPGAGKGTQAAVLSKALELAHVSSGDIFRENLKAQTELGKLAQTFMSRGELVPDDVTIAMIEERLSRPDCAQGALLDGFPRTLPRRRPWQTCWPRRVGKWMRFRISPCLPKS